MYGCTIITLPVTSWCALVAHQHFTCVALCLCVFFFCILGDDRLKMRLTIKYVLLLLNLEHKMFPVQLETHLKLADDNQIDRCRTN